jgi:hypothetical protein
MARAVTRDLTRLGFVLTPGVVRGRWVARCAWVVLGVLAGAAAIRVYDETRSARTAAPLSVAAPATDAAPLKQQLEQSQLTLRVAESRSQEQERQIATLVQQLRESQEELTFFKKTRDGKSSAPKTRASRQAQQAEPESSP